MGSRKISMVGAALTINFGKLIRQKVSTHHQNAKMMTSSMNSQVLDFLENPTFFPTKSSYRAIQPKIQQIDVQECPASIPNTIFTQGQMKTGLSNEYKTFRRSYSTLPPKEYTGVPQIFDWIRATKNPEMVKKVKACLVFEVTGGGKYYLDFRQGEGEVGEGEYQPKDVRQKPEVTISISQTNILKLFNKELESKNAFLTGKLRIFGDLSKAMALEKALKDECEKAFKAEK